MFQLESATEVTNPTIQVWGDASGDTQVPLGIRTSSSFDSNNTGTHPNYPALYADWASWDERKEWTGLYNIPQGDWQVHLSKRNWVEVPEGGTPGAANYSECSDFHGVTVKVTEAGRSRLFAPSRKVTPLGAESDLDCQAGESHSSRFHLVDFPGMIHAVPVAVGGHSRYAGSRLRSVTVTDWNNADELHLRRGGAHVLLTPSNPTAQIPVDNHWLGSSRWSAHRVADEEAHGYPEIELGLECPAAPPADNEDAAVGYGLSLAQLNAAFGQASGGLSLGSWIEGAANATLPVYAVRIEPVFDPPPAGPTHSLRLELRNSYAVLGLPLVQTGPDAWSLDAEDETLILQGTVTRQVGTLTLQLEAGSYSPDGTPFTLQPTTLVLSTLGGQ